MTIERIRYIDSHTGGEPTRLILSGMPELGAGSLAERALRFARDHDQFRSAVVQEPRGSDVLVGALWQEPVDPEAAAGVIFFNNVGILGMCGHGTIGVVASLAYLGRLQPGTHRIETPVGDITVTLHDDHRVSVRNVPSYRTQASVSLDVPGVGHVVGDVAWGGNWFFLVSEHQEELHLKNLRRLLEVTTKIRHALEAAGIRGSHGEVIDHIELFGPAQDAANHSRNYVLCPGLEYDRSPCGTGTSAKLACLAAAGKLAAGAIWRQESIIGSVFESCYEWIDGTRVSPTITGRAWITAEGELLRMPDDPFRDGIRR